MFCTDTRTKVFGWNAPISGFESKRRHELDKLVQPPSTYLLAGRF